MSGKPAETTRLIHRAMAGDKTAQEHLFEKIYDQLHQLSVRHMRAERGNHTLQPTALIHEAYMKMLGRENTPQVNDRQHFMALASTVMRRILVSHARERRAQRRGGQYTHVEIRDNDAQQSQSTDLIALDQALDQLAQIAPRQHRIVEMRFFGGLTLQEMATHLNLSTAMVSKDLATAKAWLMTSLNAH